MELKESKLYFFRVTDRYISFLQNIDGKIMNNRNENRERIYLGILFTIGRHQYYAPITSYKEDKHGNIKNSDQTCFIIYGKDREEDEPKKLALINLNNMFPVIQSEIFVIEFDKEEEKYKDLLEKEYRFVTSNQDKIIRRALKLHELRTKKNIQKINRLCCDFTKLEEEYVKFVK
ncbi:type III toxin-antitoxin system ToxN/AbiQ family toxin [Alkalihalobacillus sp. BA299]|uniref:type III toxin-antitoxin system ToxN/AbiQ family toxin n=1 Tax=Alkalihalobacillus sp. BA299 TaxID=2815938 RepID=UPI001ADB0E25|nr:type III toxin-antitoxin system ToxN/AbiQ family toxin [Alkalihalobacillus sp. BA299]